MDLKALYPILLSQAPNMIQYLTGVGGHISQYPNILKAIENGYDIPLMDENIADIGRAEWDDGGIPKYQQMLGHEVLDFANSKDYNTNITPYDPNGLPPSGFESANANANEFSNLFKTLNTAEQRQQIGGPSAMLSAATFEANPPQVIPDHSGIGALYDEVAQDYKNGQFSDNNLYPVDSYTTPNPATGYSQEDWDFDEVDDAADNPYAKNALLEKIRKKRGK